MTFIGKFHPLAVHFPIACITLAAIIEGYRFVRRESSIHQSSKWLLSVGVVTGLVAVLLGIWNADGQSFYGQASELVYFHRLISLIAIAGAIITVWLIVRKSHSATLISATLIRMTLFLSFGFLTYGAHQGALLVHGADYFSFDFGSSKDVKAKLQLPPTFSKAQLDTLPKPITRNVAYQEDIEPLFRRSCNRCHGGGKKKGEFQLDTKQWLLKGGESGPSVIPGNSRDSYLIHLVAGLHQENFMPEKGRPLTDGEVGILRAWIDQGLPWDGELSPEIAVQATSNTLRVVSLPQCKSCLEETNAIDRFLTDYFKKKSLKWPKEIDEGRYIRRVYLDTIGRLPRLSEVREAEELLASNNRIELIYKLLNDNEGFADHWLSYWNDLLRNDYTGPGFQQKNASRKRKEITGWLRRALVQNMPYDRMVTGLVAPNRRAEGFVRGILWSGVINPNERPEMQAAQNIGQVFLGINLKCASCHDSFTNQWTLEDSYGLASVYSKEPLEIYECDKATGHNAHPSFLFESTATLDEAAPPKERAEQLAKLLTDEDNGRFSRTIVNRIWAKLFGRGFSEPLDDYALPGWNADLHDWLAVHFVQSGYDIKSLLTLILNSKAYRLQAVPLDADLSDDTKYQFQGPVYRPLTAEQLFDSIYAFYGIAGYLTPSDMKRMSQFSEQREKKEAYSERHGLQGSEDVQEVSFTPKSGDDYWLQISIPVRKKRKNTEVLESQIAVQKISIIDEQNREIALNSNSFLEHYRIDKPEETFLERKGRTSFLHGTGLFHIRVPEGVNQPKQLKVELKRQGEVQFPVEMKLYSGLRVRSSLREQNELLAAFGRPKRVQVTTNRDTLFSGSRVLKLATDPHWEAYTRFVADALLSSPERSEELKVLFGRDFEENEGKLIEQYVNEQPADLVWALMLHPDVLVLS